MREHYEAMLSEYGNSVGVRVARKHLDWYLGAAGIQLDQPERSALIAGDEPRAILAMLPAVYGSERRLAA